MDMHFDSSLASDLKNTSQIVRRMSESWVESNIYCPRCGEYQLTKLANNTPVADFRCRNCNREFELKSKKGKLPNTILGGAYTKMLGRISGKESPDFMFLVYSPNLEITSVTLIPYHFFTPDMIEQRSPLSPNAKRAGWIGCKILLNKIPSSGKIELIAAGMKTPPEIVVNNFKSTQFLSSADMTERGWIVDVMRCIEATGSEHFTLEELYRKSQWLTVKYPENSHIQEKIRQQLQLLRDKRYIRFDERGTYSRVPRQ